MRLTIDTVGNGYVLVDDREGETWVVETAEDDDPEAVRRLLVEVNERIGRHNDGFQAENVEVLITPGRKWLDHHGDECRHDRIIERWADGERVRFSCFCGLEFAPIPAGDGGAERAAG